MGTKWFNQDGLTVRYGTRPTSEDADVPAQPSTMGRVQELEIVLGDLSALPLNDATGVAAGEFVNSAKIPTGATIISAEVIVDTAAAGATADLLIGAYSVNASTGQLTSIDPDGFCTAANGDVAALTPAGTRIACSGALIGGVASASADVVVAAAYATAAFTAGAVRCRIEYRL